MTEIIYETGDAIKIAINYAKNKNKKIILAHGENNIGVHGAGFAKQLTKKFPENGYKFENDCKKRIKLGETSWFNPENIPNLQIANCITQKGLRSKNNPIPFKYDAFKECMNDLKRISEENIIDGIVMPMIGAGLAGGDWGKISDIINSIFEKSKVKVIVVIFK